MVNTYMHFFLNLRSLAALSALLPCAVLAGQPPARLAEHSASGLELRLAQIDAELEQLAHYSLCSGVGSIGYRSKTHGHGENTEWIEIELGQEFPLDEVMLVPTIWRDTEKGFQADGFPLEFRILAGTRGDPEGFLVASYGMADGILPRLAPVIVPCTGAMVSWVRIEAARLSPRAFDGMHLFQLAEILVFSGKENVALRKPLKTSSNVPGGSTAWDAQFAVDGFMPYLMDAAQGAQSIAYLSPIGSGDRPAISIDLGQPQPVSGMHLHAVDQSDTVPQAYAGDFGIPHHFLVEGADRADFSDARPLLEVRIESIYDTGPIMMWHFPETTCRHVRLTALDPFRSPGSGDQGTRIGFAELELLSNGRNIASGKPVSANFASTDSVRSLAALTDGNNLYGQILPLRDWLNQLARRHALETERPRVAEELNRRYARQKETLVWLSWLVVGLAAMTVIIVLADRMIRQRVVFNTRERIAADLHDELGANLHAIGLLGDLALAATDAPGKLATLLQRMRALTERTGAAARYCTNLLEAKDLYGDLVGDMRRTSARIMADFEHDISFDGEEILRRLKPRRRIDLFLFYKECLINILRHSGATHATTALVATPREIRLTITDNGHGFTGEVPASLRRRARLLGASVVAERAEPNGTRIMLKLKTGTLGGFK